MIIRDGCLTIPKVFCGFLVASDKEMCIGHLSLWRVCRKSLRYALFTVSENAVK